MEKIKVEIKQDLLAKLSAARPHLAIAELIWNGLDADASNVVVDVNRGPLLTEWISVRDNGKAFARKEAQKLFSNLGSSWKHTAQKTKDGRVMHGREGQGRFKAFSLGDHVEWSVVYADGTETKKFEISGRKESITEFSISDEKPVQGLTGVITTIREVVASAQALEQVDLQKKLAPIFAPYLSTYKGVVLDICGSKLDIQAMVEKDTEIPLDDVLFGGKTYSVSVEIIEWKELEQRELWACSGEGFPLLQLKRKIRVGDFSYSAYIKTEVFRLLHQDNLLELEDMNPEAQGIIDHAVKAIKEHFRKRTLELSKDVIKGWKDAHIYPYKTLAQNPIEEAERQVFEIVALNVRDNLPTFEAGDKKTKAFQLLMLRQAIENSPDELKTILSEVLDLPKDKQEDLSELLKETNLSSVIAVSKKIADRLKTITALEEILFNRDIADVVKERSQLHKIIEDNIWLFGEGYSLSVSDQSLSQVLRAHNDQLSPDAVIDDPVLRIDRTKGIVDLMLSRVIPTHTETLRNHLIIELKAPSVKVGRKEIAQIESYAMAVAADARFSGINTLWEFYVISTDLDEYAKLKLKEDHVKDGAIIRRSTDPKFIIYIKTWAEILNSNRFRLGFIKEILNSNFGKDESLAYLQKKYEKYTGFLKKDVEPDTAEHGEGSGSPSAPFQEPPSED